LVGTCGATAADKWGAQWSGKDGTLPEDVVIGARTMLDWIRPLAAMTKATSPPMFDMTRHGADDVKGWQSPAAKGQQETDEQKAIAALQPLACAPALEPVAQQALDR